MPYVVISTEHEGSPVLGEYVNMAAEDSVCYIDAISGAVRWAPADCVKVVKQIDLAACLPIEELDMGVRAYNFAKRFGVDTIGELAELTIVEVNSWSYRSGTFEIRLGMRAFLQLAAAQADAIAIINPEGI
jgi:hypothetical protein